MKVIDTNCSNELQKICIVFDENSWIQYFVEKLKNRLEKKNFNVCVRSSFDEKNCYDVVFILGYTKIIEEKYLKLNRHNIVVHESDLPFGKGWSPLSWQILQGKNEIVFSMFEAAAKVDSGVIYEKRKITFSGNELIDEIREIAGLAKIDMCEKFLDEYTHFIKNSYSQTGTETFFSKRTAKDSELDFYKSLSEQFGLLRIVDNEKYPAFFLKDGEKFIVKIYKEYPNNIGGGGNSKETIFSSARKICGMRRVA